MTRYLPVVAALAVALFACMAWYSWTVLLPAAGGLLPFDARVLGYTPAEAQAYLRALDGAGRAVYLVEMNWLDTAFAPVAGLAAGLGVLILTLGRARLLRLALLVPVVAYLLADLAEGITVQEMLRRGVADFTPLLAEWASLFTQAKFGFALLVALVLVGLGVPRALRA